jgi:hypothetical protein
MSLPSGVNCCSSNYILLKFRNICQWDKIRWAMGCIVFGSRWEEVTGEWRKAHELNNLHFSPIYYYYYYYAYSSFLLFLLLSLILPPLVLQPSVGFGLSNNILPFFLICHQLSPSHTQHTYTFYLSL